MFKAHISNNLRTHSRWATFSPFLALSAHIIWSGVMLTMCFTRCENQTNSQSPKIEWRDKKKEKWQTNKIAKCKIQFEMENGLWVDALTYLAE